jgi:D-hydroxyproline dehydrogenase subunit beta
MSSSGPLPARADVAVVGAGIVGLAHALAATERGLSVVVVDRDPRAVGASVRNFGHGFASAMAAGEPYEAALEARRRWVELGGAAGFAVREAGTLLVLRHEDELAAAHEFCATGERGARVIGAGEAARLAPIPTGGLVGALHVPGDVVVDSRAAVAAIAAWLEAERGVRFLWGAAASAVRDGVVETSRGTVGAPLVVVAPGPDVQTLFPEVFAARDGLTRTKLQMLRVRAPGGRRYAPALLTGLSLVRYPGFTALPAVDAVRRRLRTERPEVLDHGVHLIVTQRPEGDLIIGDTHEEGMAVSPFGEERLDELLLAEARRLLGAEHLDVVERWHGIYPTAPGHPFLVAAPAAGVRVVSIVSGIGMTTALGLAPRVLDGLVEDYAALAPSAMPARGSASARSVIAKASPR